MEKPKAVFNWSGGKDSALALYKVLKEGKYEVVALLTTVNRDKQRSTMHDIPLALLEKQAKSIGIPLHIVNLPPAGSSEDYKNKMLETVEAFKDKGVTHFIFGDIFLHDVRKYREEALNPEGITVVEPLWDMTTAEVMEEFLTSGLKTIIVTTTASELGKEFIGQHITKELISEFPPHIDVCGENGEYHTFCYDGPIFRTPVPFTTKEPFRMEFPIKLDTGETKIFGYWFAGLDE